MSLVMADGGLELKMSGARAAWNSTHLKMHLYKTNVTPTTSSTVGSFTECDFAGYAAQDLINWTAPSTTGHVTTIQADPLTFTRSTTGTVQNVYGYYITDSAGTTLYWAELDPAGPRTVTNSGDTVTVTAKITDQTL